MWFYQGRRFGLFGIVLCFIVSLLAMSSVQAVDVSGPITSNTTWTAANSPYVVVGGIVVDNGVTLTIDPGVEVRVDPVAKSGSILICKN